MECVRVNVTSSIRCLGAVSLLAFVSPSIGFAAGAGAVELISVGMGGAPANGDSLSPSRVGASSANGRFVVFSSEASNLVPSDTNGQRDVFVRDRTKRTTRMVSLRQNGTASNASSGAGVISADGRVVAFFSAATDLVSGDTNGEGDIFVRDLRAGTTRRVSVATDGTQANGFSGSPSISANGRYVAFELDATNLVPNDTNGRTDIFLRDLKKARTLRVSLAPPFAQANDNSSDPVLSRDGRFVAFMSYADNLVPGDTNGAGTLQGIDIFVRDRRNQTVRRASLTQAGGQVSGSSQGPAMSPDGRYVSFHSSAPGIVPGDTNGVSDIFVRDLRANTTNRVSLRTGFSQGGQGSFDASISANGKKVAFLSFSRLAPTDRDNRGDIYLRDRRAQSTRLLSVALPGVPPVSDYTSGAAISADGKVVVFTSFAENLVRGDTNGFQDVFVAKP